MRFQMVFGGKDWDKAMEAYLEGMIDVTTIARQRLTVDHLQAEYEKEKIRFARLKQPKALRDSGIRVVMLRDKLYASQDTLRELLVAQGYLRGTHERQS